MVSKWLKKWIKDTKEKMSKIFLLLNIVLLPLFASIHTNRQPVLVVKFSDEREVKIIEAYDKLLKLTTQNNWDSLEIVVNQHDSIFGYKEWLYPFERFFITALYSDISFLKDTSNYSKYLEMNNSETDKDYNGMLPKHTVYAFGARSNELLDKLLEEIWRKVDLEKSNVDPESDFVKFLEILFPWNYHFGLMVYDALKFIEKFPKSQYYYLIKNHYIYYCEWSRSGFFIGSLYGITIHNSDINNIINPYFSLQVPFDIYLKSFSIKLHYGLDAFKTKAEINNDPYLIPIDESLVRHNIGLGIGYLIGLHDRFFTTPYIKGELSIFELEKSFADSINVDDTFNKQVSFKGGVAFDYLVPIGGNNRFFSPLGLKELVIRFDISYDHLNYDFLEESSRRGSWTMCVGVGALLGRKVIKSGYLKEL